MTVAFISYYKSHSLKTMFQPGCVSKFKLNTKNIISTVAKDAENKGHFEDAAMLYDLADVRFLFENIFVEAKPQNESQDNKVLRKLR